MRVPIISSIRHQRILFCKKLGQSLSLLWRFIISLVSHGKNYLVIIDYFRPCDSQRTLELYLWKRFRLITLWRPFLWLTKLVKGFQKKTPIPKQTWHAYLAKSIFQNQKIDSLLLNLLRNFKELNKFKRLLLQSNT